jgi:pimeloyl-[acyl-carrier protein] methyl ester esterase
MSLWHDTAGAGPDLVLLHGWGMNAAVWRPLLPGLQERFRVTRIELPGHGASPLLEGGLDAWTRACLEVAPARAAWVGWSLGGLLALRAALFAPQRVAHLCLVTATPSFVQRAAWPQAMPAAVFEQFAQVLLEDPAATLKRFLGLQVKGAEDARTTLRTLGEALAQRPDPQPRGLQLGLQLLHDGDLRDRLQQLQVASHWLFGARDTLVPAGVADTIRERLPQARVQLVEGAGHAPFLSHPQRCLHWLEESCGS